MNYKKQGLKALGLSFVAALGLMAFTAAGAQASGTVTVQGLSPPFTTPIAGTIENALHANSRLLILKLNLEISCHKGKAAGHLSNAGHGHAEIIFEHCLAKGVGQSEAEACLMENNIVAKVLALVILHGEANKPFIRFSPLEGESFALVLEHTCPIPEHALIKGSVVAEIVDPELKVGSKLITTKGMLSLFTGDKLFYGANEAHLDADALVSLVNHPTAAWSVS
jgi:hypothetical protein